MRRFTVIRRPPYGTISAEAVCVAAVHCPDMGAAQGFHVELGLFRGRHRKDETEVPRTFGPKLSGRRALQGAESVRHSGLGKGVQVNRKHCDAVHITPVEELVKGGQDRGGGEIGGMQFRVVEGAPLDGVGGLERPVLSVVARSASRA